MSDAWPELLVSEWEDTRDTLLIWTQIVGKIRLALAPMVNHWWQVPFYVSVRGLGTSLMHFEDLGIEAEFDFSEHVLEFRTSNAARRSVALETRSVANFYDAVRNALDDLGVSVGLYEKPVEMPVSIPFREDDSTRAYDPEAVHRYWLVLLQAHRVMSVFRGRFSGKASPVHWFWGAGDLAVTRFSGRVAPKHPGGVPNCPDIVQELAYNRELSSCGFWAGGSEEGSFYSYAYPQPEGFEDWPVPAPGRYDRSLGEFLLPYREVRLAEHPDKLLLSFLQSSYEAAAELQGWDRGILEE